MWWICLLLTSRSQLCKAQQVFQTFVTESDECNRIPVIRICHLLFRIPKVHSTSFLILSSHHDHHLLYQMNPCNQETLHCRIHAGSPSILCEFLAWGPINQTKLLTQFQWNHGKRLWWLNSKINLASSRSSNANPLPRYQSAPNSISSNGCPIWPVQSFFSAEGNHCSFQANWTSSINCSRGKQKRFLNLFIKRGI